MHKLILVLLFLAAACAGGPERPAAEAPLLPLTRGVHPSKGEVPVSGAEAPFAAYLVHDNGGIGVWTVKSFEVFEQYGCPEVVGLDDLGRLSVHVSYSGKWTARWACDDTKWLGGLAQGDVDHRVAGAELYTGGQLGRLYQVVPHREGVLDARIIAKLPGREIHTIVAGDLDPRVEGPELLVFTRPGGLFRVTPDGPDGTFRTEHLADLPGRVRDAAVVGPGQVATVGRHGKVELLTITADGPQWRTVHELTMGRGRLAVGARSGAGELVLYSTADDGRVFRHQGTLSGPWRTETIHRGSQGPRGLTAGRFLPGDGEQVAVYGYSGEVLVLSRGASGREEQVVFRDRARGHWLCRAELDGRNETDELLVSGYGARIVLLVYRPR